jgi:hypothetical protein
MDNLPLDLVGLLVEDLYEICDISFFMLSMVSNRWYVYVIRLALVRNIHSRDIITLTKIVSRGYLSILQEYLHKTRTYHIKNLYETAVENGHLHIMKWAKKKGFFLEASNPFFCTTALERKEYDIFKWALNHGCRWSGRCTTESPIDYAIRLGDVDLLKWAITTKWYTSDPKLCARAACHGQLECLKILRAHGCMWNSETCSEAALNGHLEILKWARGESCDWTSGVCLYAISHDTPRDIFMGRLKWLSMYFLCHGTCTK